MIIKNDHLEISPSLIIHGFSILFVDIYVVIFYMTNFRYKTTLSIRPLFLGAVEWSYKERRLYLTKILIIDDVHISMMCQNEKNIHSFSYLLSHLLIYSILLFPSHTSLPFNPLICIAVINFLMHSDETFLTLVVF